MQKADTSQRKMHLLLICYSTTEAGFNMEGGVVWNLGMQLLDPATTCPFQRATGSYHKTRKSKISVCWSCSVFSVHCSPPTVGGMGACPAQAWCPGHAAPPCIRLQHAREPVSAPGHGGNKGLGGLGALGYEDTFCLLRGQSAFLCITCHRRRKARHLKYSRQEQSSSLSSMIDHTCSQQYGHTANPKKWVSKRSIN